MKIQKKFFLFFSIGIFSFIILGVLFNYLLLEKYYIYKSQQEFIKASQKIQKKIENKKDNLDKYITRYGKKNNVRIIVLNSGLEIEETSYYIRNGNVNTPLKKIKKLVKEKENNEYICKVFKQKKTSSAKIFFMAETSNGKYLLLMKNTKKVHESALTANEFYLVIGIILLICGLFLSSIFSKMLTRPVIIMNNVTKEMARLNFEHKIPEKGNDEISELAHNINLMSTQLYTCITKMEQDIERRKQLIRDLSHELKSPIAVIKGYADGLRYGVADNTQAIEKYCKVIANECEHMDKMVKEMLELSNLEQIAVPLKFETILIYDIVEKFSSKYNHTLKQKECKLFINGEKNTTVTADIKLLECIIGNLLGNAVKYVTDDGIIKINIHENETETIFSIFNTSEPVPEDKIEKIWDAFYKLDNARKRERDSHGIGLTIVKSAVRLHNGTVFAKNIDNGIVFEITFPKRKK